jgi:hypothetical protein
MPWPQVGRDRVLRPRRGPPRQGGVRAGWARRTGRAWDQGQLRRAGHAAPGKGECARAQGGAEPGTPGPRRGGHAGAVPGEGPSAPGRGPCWAAAGATGPA